MEFVDCDINLSVDDLAAEKIKSYIESFDHEALDNAAKTNRSLREALDENKDRRSVVVLIEHITTQSTGPLKFFNRSESKWTLIFNEEWVLYEHVIGIPETYIGVMRIRAGEFTFYSRITPPEKVKEELNNGTVTVKKGLLTVRTDQD